MSIAMPHSSREALLPIQESLQSSLSKGVAPSGLDQRIVSNSKQILMHKIQFRPAEKASHSYQLDSLRAKYTPLNATSGKCSSPELVEGYKKLEGGKMVGESLPAPKVVLYPPEKVSLEWSKVRPSGAGLVNLGNTCFLNSTLQCLTYTAPLLNYLKSEDHSNTCKLAGFCMLCELHRHIKRCFDQPGTIKPLSIVHKLRVIAKHMHLGRQEDAHEFLRYVIDHMQKACLYGYSKLDNFSKETTAINQIFGGYLRSQVLCLKCNSRSNTYDPFLDISLDIKNSPSVVKALERYIHPERLDSDNAYNCTKCRQKVPAQKRFTIHKAPNVLTIQLKRFDCSRPSAKVTRHVHYPEKLDLRPYMSIRNDLPVFYQLYAVLVHSGYSCNSGHYYCFVKAPNRVWHCMNDQHVAQIGVNRVLNAEAYLLFYKRVGSSQQIKGPMIGPHLPKPANGTVPRPNQNPGKSSMDVGLPVSRKPLIKTSTVVREGQTASETISQNNSHRPETTSQNNSHRPETTNQNNSHGPETTNQNNSHRPETISQNNSRSLLGEVNTKSHQHPMSQPVNRPPTPQFPPTSIPMPSQRNKISFGMKPKDNLVDTKPRLVMRIKHGTVCYNSSVEDRSGSDGEKNAKQPHRHGDTTAKPGAGMTAKPGVGTTAKPGTGTTAKPGPGGDGNSVSPPKYGEGTSSRLPHKLVPYKGGSDSESDEGKPVKVNGESKPHVFSPVPKAMKPSFEPVIDDKLTTTTTVPGAYGSLDRASAWMAGKKSRSGLSKDDFHSYVPVNKARPLRRSLSDDGLTIDTSPLKLNATTHWNILDTDAQVSPSIASGSSNTSMNSTTEWHIRNKHKQMGQLVAEAQHIGWKITPVRPTKPDASARTNHVSTNEAENPVSAFARQISSSSLPAGESEKTNEDAKLKVSISDSELASHKHKKKAGFSRLLCLNTLTDSPGDREPLVKDRSYDMSVYDFHDEDSSISVSKKPQDEDMPNQNEQEKQTELDEKPEKNNLATIYGDIMSKLQKKHKKNKKHKKKHKKRHGDLEELLDSSVTDGDVAIPKHKKKHKKRHGDLEELLDSSVTDGDMAIPKHKKKKKKKRRYEESDSEEGVVKKKQRAIETDEDTSNDQEYAWVEKSKDTNSVTEVQAQNGQVQHTANHKNHSQTHPPVPVQLWDHHIKDPHKQPTAVTETNGAKASPKPAAWDGTRTNNGAEVISELLKGSSRGFGGQVLSWDGSRSTVDEDAAHDKKNDHKRRWSDEYEEELDRGKVKKMKKPAENSTNNHGNHTNMFQSYHDSRTADKERRKSGFLSPEREHRQRDYDINGNHHKSSFHGYHNHNHGTNHRDGYHRDGYYNKGYSERH